MIGVAIDILIDLFMFVFPLSMVSKKLKLKPLKLADLKPVLRELGFSRISKKDFVKHTALVFFALVFLSVVLSFTLNLFQANDLEAVAREVSKIGAISPLLLAYLLIVRVSAEEVLFRGYLVKRVGIGWSSALFAAVHVFYGSFAEVLGAFVLGLVLAFKFRQIKNIYPLIAAHMLYNLFALWILFGVF